MTQIQLHRLTLQMQHLLILQLQILQSNLYKRNEMRDWGCAYRHILFFCVVEGGLISIAFFWKNACDLRTIEAIMMPKSGYFSEILVTCAASALIM